MFAHMPIIRDIVYGAVRHGAPLEELCSKADIPLFDLNDSEKKVDFERAYRVWELAIKMTHDAFLGLHIGEKTNPSILGLVGHLMQSCDTLFHAFEKVCQHNLTITDMFRYKMKVSGNRVMLQFEPIDLWVRVSPISARHAVDQSMAGTLHVFQLLCGERIQPEKATLVSKKTATTKDYDRVLRCPIQFQAAENTLVFRKSDLDKTIISYDQSLLSLFDEMIEERKRKSKATFASEVKNILTIEFKGQAPALEILASRFHMTTRTLQRSLKENGLNYRDLGKQVKKDVAMRLLESRDRKVGEIATLLGYSEPSAFQRAFKNWSSMTPGKVKRSA